MSVGWLTVRAWVDLDGRHVWLAHDCKEGRVTTMLPWPNWHSTGLKVEPSFSCGDCGVHTFAVVDIPDDEYRCTETFENDGRWCERMTGHEGAHLAGLISWGTYVRPTA